jgi:hypothetical protein
MQSGSLRASPHLFTSKSRTGDRVSDCIPSGISRKSNINYNYDPILNFDTCRTPAVTVSSPEDDADGSKTCAHVCKKTLLPVLAPDGNKLPTDVGRF